MKNNTFIEKENVTSVKQEKSKEEVLQIGHKIIDLLKANNCTVVDSYRIISGLYKSILDTIKFMGGEIKDGRE